MLQHRIFEGQEISQRHELEDYAFYQRWSLETLLFHTERLNSEGAFGAAACIYKNWIACNPNHPLLHVAYYNYSFSLAKSGDLFGAIAVARECQRLKPDFTSLYMNLGRLLEEVGQHGHAIVEWRNLINLLPQIQGSLVREKIAALEQSARVLEMHNIDNPAEETMRFSLDISIHQPSIVQHYIALRQRQCKWPSVQGWEGVSRERLISDISPLSLATISNDPLFQLARAALYYRQLVGPRLGSPIIEAPTPIVNRKSGPLRIGYVSSDFREHAVGFAMTDVLEAHNKNNVEVFAYYCGIENNDGIKQRCRSAVNHWIDINAFDDVAAAKQIRVDEIDILVDLNGFTKGARTKIFALRPAPIIVNWFGFPGTMGSPDHHYIIADPHIIPQENELYYSEKIVRLSCYQPNDRKRVVASTTNRAQEGLPEGAFVYCCLNGPQKFTPSVFAVWMRILNATPNSVLWLFGGEEDTNDRLRAMARELGVAPERLIIAEKKPNPIHVARYALADLFLDTFPYGSHTTASDALWMGLPVLTLAGRTFASRVCVSLLHAAGLGDLACSSIEQYAVMAVALANNRDVLAVLKQRLVKERDACRLFDTPKLVSELEAAYQTMHEDYAYGRLPRPKLINMDIYHEIGIALSGSECDENAYLAIYTDQLSQRDNISPLPSDGRFWSIDPAR